MANDSIGNDIDQAVLSEIRGLTLPNIDNQTEIRLIEAIPDEGSVNRGINILATEDQVKPYWPADRDDIGYDLVILMILGEQDGGDGGNRKMFRHWRQVIRRHFINQRVTGVSQSFTVHAIPGRVIQDEKLYSHYDHSDLLLRCWCRETRG